MRSVMLTTKRPFGKIKVSYTVMLTHEIMSLGELLDLCSRAEDRCNRSTAISTVVALSYGALDTRGSARACRTNTDRMVECWLDAKIASDKFANQNGSLIQAQVRPSPTPIPE